VKVLSPNGKRRTHSGKKRATVRPINVGPVLRGKNVLAEKKKIDCDERGEEEKQQGWDEEKKVSRWGGGNSRNFKPKRPLWGLSKKKWWVGGGGKKKKNKAPKGNLPQQARSLTCRNKAKNFTMQG